jgi:SAM-dependent methyltransferase
MAASTPAARADPFALPGGGRVPRRPRLTSHVGRTGRARRWLPSDALRVLDVGCASGYGAAGLAAAGPPGRVVIGVERDRAHLADARRRYPWLTILEGDATDLPLADGCADAVVMLDMLEYLAEPRRAVQEAHRVLRPGGAVIVSLPHAGPLRAIDSLNLYPRLRRRRPQWPPLPGADISQTGRHEHYRLDELRELLAPWFVVERMTRTGLGIAELFALARLVARATRRAPRTAALLEALFVLSYLCEDVVPLGPLGYHLAVRARPAR